VGPPLELLFSIASGMIVAMIGTAVLLGAIGLPMLALRSLWSRLDQTPLGRHGHFQNRTFRKTANVVLLTLALFAILYWGDQFGTLDSDRSVNLRRRSEVGGLLFFGLLILMFVFADELKISNSVDANGRAIESDERADRGRGLKDATHVEHVDALLRARYVAALTDYLPGKLAS